MEEPRRVTIFGGLQANNFDFHENLSFSLFFCPVPSLNLVINFPTTPQLHGNG